MVSFIDAHRDAYGVESICTQLPIVPSTYYEHKAREIDPGRWQHVPNRLNLRLILRQPCKMLANRNKEVTT